MGYSDAELAVVPEGANLGLGCGNPLALSGIEPGMTVLDLGSGAGFDAFLAWKKVGTTGRPAGRRERERHGHRLQRLRTHLPTRDLLAALKSGAVNDSVQILGLPASAIDGGGARWTAREIEQQPSLWPQIARRVMEDRPLNEFLRARLAR